MATVELYLRLVGYEITKAWSQKSRGLSGIFTTPALEMKKSAFCVIESGIKGGELLDLASFYDFNPVFGIFFLRSRNVFLGVLMSIYSYQTKSVETPDFIFVLFFGWLDSTSKWDPWIEFANIRIDRHSIVPLKRKRLALSQTGSRFKPQLRLRQLFYQAPCHLVAIYIVSKQSKEETSASFQFSIWS